MKKEIRIYAVDLNEAPDEVLDFEKDEWMDLSEEQGLVFTIDGLIEWLNDAEVITCSFRKYEVETAL